MTYSTKISKQKKDKTERSTRPIEESNAYSTEISQQKKDKAERSTGLGRRIREVIGNGNERQHWDSTAEKGQSGKIDRTG